MPGKVKKFQKSKTEVWTELVEQYSAMLLFLKERGALLTPGTDRGVSEASAGIGGGDRDLQSVTAVTTLCVFAIKPVARTDTCCGVTRGGTCWGATTGVKC